MLKNLTILALTAALLPACVIDVGDTLTDTFATSDATTGGTTGGSTGGTTGEATTGETDGGTTASVPTTGEPASSTGEATSGSTGGTTGGTSEYGMCGWSPMNYYGCVNPDGAEPGAVDPMGIDPIDCKPDVIEGAPCTDMDGPVTNIGCCAVGGNNYFCDNGTIAMVACGA